MHPILLFVFSRHTSVYKFSSRCCRRSEMFQAQFDNKSSKWVDLSSLSKSATDRKGSSITLCIFLACLCCNVTQVARTISNMQQQIQQHQRQLAQALLMKQQQPPPSHPGLHPGGAKSTMDSFPSHPQAPGLSDLQTKEPQSSPNTYSPYSLCEWPLRSLLVPPSGPVH